MLNFDQYEDQVTGPYLFTFLTHLDDALSLHHEVYLLSVYVGVQVVGFALSEGYARDVIHVIYYERLSIPMEIDGTITFFYYDDLERATEFYENIMGFEKVIAIKLAKVFRVHGDSHVGLVDGHTGYLKWSESKPVMLSWFSDDIDGWYMHLKTKGVEIEQPPEKQSYLEMKTLLFRDPEGYLLEILQWVKKPYGQ